jgi:hypothetical protein
MYLSDLAAFRLPVYIQPLFYFESVNYYLCYMLK